MEVAMEEGEPSALVQEADCAERVVVLKIRVPGETSWIVVGAASGGRAAAGGGPSSGAGLLSTAVRQEIWGARLPPGSTRQRPREVALVGAKVVALGPAEVWIDRDGASRVLRAQGGRVVVTDAPVADGATRFVGASDEARAAWAARGAELARALADDAVEVWRGEIHKAFEKARSRIARRRVAIGEDLAKIAQAERIAGQATWLVAEAARVPRGATKLVVTDWSTGEAVSLEVPLDPATSARAQVEAMFKRAKRLKLGARVAEGRLAQADAQAAGIELAAQALAVATSLPAIDEAAREAKRAAPRDVSLPGTAAPAGTRAKGAKARTPFRTFLSRSGRKILVGKGAADNDALTQKTARPHDLWLHAKDRTGGHVIVQLEKTESCPAEDLVDAAHLAAHFSDARDEKVVDVQYTHKRHLRKPRGSPPGFVVVEREKVIVLRAQPELLRVLLEREET